MNELKGRLRPLFVVDNIAALSSWATAAKGRFLAAMVSWGKANGWYADGMVTKVTPK